MDLSADPPTRPSVSLCRACLQSRHNIRSQYSYTLNEIHEHHWSCHVNFVTAFKPRSVMRSTTRSAAPKAVFSIQRCSWVPHGLPLLKVILNFCFTTFEWINASWTNSPTRRLSNKQTRRENQLTDVMVPSFQMMLCGVELISSGSELHPLDLVPKNIFIDSDQLEFFLRIVWYCENSYCNRTCNINSFIKDTRQTVRQIIASLSCTRKLAWSPKSW